MKDMVSRVISAIKGEPYKLDESMSNADLLIILKEKGLQTIRGFWKSLFFKSKTGIVFVGRKVKIKHASHISTGKGLTLGDGVQINALCKEGVIFGENVTLGSGSILECTGVIRELGEGIRIGNHVGFAQRAFIASRGGIEIGDDCIFGPNVSIHAENHEFGDVDTPIRLQGVTRKGVRIGKGCWVGNGAIILDGVDIGDGCIVAANAVVNKSIPCNCIVAGVPAKIIKSREDSK